VREAQAGKDRGRARLRGVSARVRVALVRLGDPVAVAIALPGRDRGSASRSTVSASSR
jgi:hypothetical protein